MTRINSKAIEHLHPLTQPKAIRFLKLCAERGIEVKITCTYRNGEEQNYLYSLGRTAISHVGVTAKRPLGLIVTRAKAGQSAHNFTIDGKPASKAFDIAIFRDGKIIWGTKGDGLDDDPTDDHTDDLELWQRAGEVGDEVGLDWYGKPDASFKEYPHFQDYV